MDKSFIRNHLFSLQRTVLVALNLVLNALSTFSYSTAEIESAVCHVGFNPQMKFFEIL